MGLRNTVEKKPPLLGYTLAERDYRAARQNTAQSGK